MNKDFTKYQGHILVMLQAAAEYSFESAVNIMCGKQ